MLQKPPIRFLDLIVITCAYISFFPLISSLGLLQVALFYLDQSYRLIILQIGFSTYLVAILTLISKWRAPFFRDLFQIETFKSLLCKILLRSQNPQYKGISLEKASSLKESLKLALRALIPIYGLIALLNLVWRGLYGYFDLPYRENQFLIECLQKALASQEYLLVGLIAFAVIILAPLTEEWIFRGFLHSYFRKFVNPSLAIAASAAIFAVMHIEGAMQWGNGLTLSIIFTIGVILAKLYEKTGNLLASLICHAIFNAISILIAVFSSIYISP